MDKETKELYRTVVKDLSGRSIRGSSPARLSFAVSNLFSAIKEKHHRNVERLKTLGGKIADGTASLGTSISANFQNLVQNNENKRDFINSFAETDKVQEAIDAKVDAEYSEDVQRKENLLASIQHDNRLVNAGAGFIIDVYQADVEALKNRVISERTKPHRLLVNKMFLNQFKDAAMAKRIRLRERKNLKLAVAKEVRKFDGVSYEIRKRYAADPAMIMTMLEQEKVKLSPAALDFVMLREGMGHGVTPKEVWNAYFIGLDGMEAFEEEFEMGAGAPVEAPIVPENLTSEITAVENPEQVEQLATGLGQSEAMSEQIVNPAAEENTVGAPIVSGQPVSEAGEVETTLNRDELNQNLVNVLANVQQKALETPVGQIVNPTEAAQVAASEQVGVASETPVVLEQNKVASEQPAASVVGEPVAEAQVVSQPTREPNEQETLLGGIDTLRAGYREELNDGYSYNEVQKKEWEDARLAEELVSKDSNLSYDDQEATVLSYEQNLKDQREAIMEMEKQLAVIKAAEQRIAELSKVISPDLLKQVKAEAAPVVAPEAQVVETEGRHL